ncbi:MAG: hypothetical protein KAU83_12685 [Bacteroidales bacterium]|nr:hypothetical protein [Bacteroidales bacterium]
MRKIKVLLKQFVLLMTVFLCYSELFAQTVPMGLNYQAVARDQKGDELVNRTIDVRMSVISGNPTGMVEWEEIHSGIATNPFGLFTLVIGDGIRTGGTVSNFDEIPWSGDIHFLKVEIKFNQEFLDMGTSRFLSVPYALFSRKSLTPGPAGPLGPKGDKGDPGDPASDDQVLSLEGNILSISKGNSVTLNFNDADADPFNELQNLSLDGYTLSISKGNMVTLRDSVRDDDADPGNEIQTLSKDGNIISLSKGGGTVVDEVNDADPDPTNEIQDLQLSGNILTITINDTPTEIDLSAYLDNTDDQQISYDPGTNILSLEDGGTADLSDLRNIPLNGFRAEKNISKTIPLLTDTTLVFENEVSDYGDAYNSVNGHFTAPSTGIYSFYLNYGATGDSQILRIIKNGQLFEEISNKLSSGQIVTVSFLLELDMGDSIWIQLNTGMGSTCGNGSFSGFRVH